MILNPWFLVSTSNCCNYRHRWRCPAQLPHLQTIVFLQGWLICLSFDWPDCFLLPSLLSLLSPPFSSIYSFPSFHNHECVHACLCVHVCTHVYARVCARVCACVPGCYLLFSFLSPFLLAQWLYHLPFSPFLTWIAELLDYTRLLEISLPRFYSYYLLYSFVYSSIRSVCWAFKVPTIKTTKDNN